MLKIKINQLGTENLDWSDIEYIVSNLDILENTNNITIITDYAYKDSVEKLLTKNITVQVRIDYFLRLHCGLPFIDLLKLRSPNLFLNEHILYSKWCDLTSLNFGQLFKIDSNKKYIPIGSLNELELTKISTLYNYWFEFNKLTSIKFPDTVTKILGTGVNGYNYLEYIELPNYVTYVEGIWNTKIKELIIPNTVTYLGNNGSNIYLKKVIFKPNSLLKTISSTFDSCYLLEECNLPESVTVIGSYSFRDTFNLKGTLDLSSNAITSVGLCAFLNTGLSEIKFSENTPITISLLAFFNSNLLKVDIGTPEITFTSEGNTFLNCTKLEETKIGNAKILPSGIFNGCKNLKTIYNTLENVEEIGGLAFFNTCKYEDDIIFKKLKKLNGSLHFSYISSNTENGINITFDCSDLLDFTGNTFLGSGVKNLTFTNKCTLTTLPSEFMYNSIKLDTVILCPSIEYIGASAFKNCTLKNINLNNIIFDKSINNSYMLYLCNYLENINTENINGGYFYLNCFKDTGTKADSNNIVKFNIVGDASFIYESFSNCKLLKDVILDNLLYLDRAVFINSSIENFKCNTSPKIWECGDSPFYGCSNLNVLEIGEGLELLGGSFFRELQVTKIKLPDSLIDIHAEYSDLCNARLRELDFGNGLQVIGNLSDSRISATPHGTKLHTDNVYHDLPKSLKLIGISSFLGSHLIEKAILPNIENLGKNAFLGSSITEFTPGNKLINFPSGLLLNCYRLKKVDLSQVTLFNSLPEYAFNTCYNLEEINLGENITEINSFIWDGDFNDPLTSYKLKKVIAPGVTIIKLSLFNTRARDLEELSLPNLILFTGNYAFAYIGYNKTNEEDYLDLNLPNLEYITGVRAFYSAKINNLYLPKISHLPKYCFIDYYYIQNLDLGNHDFTMDALVFDFKNIKYNGEQSNITILKNITTLGNSSTTEPSFILSRITNASIDLGKVTTFIPNKIWMTVNDKGILAYFGSLTRIEANTEPNYGGLTCIFPNLEYVEPNTISHYNNGGWLPIDMGNKIQNYTKLFKDTTPWKGNICIRNKTIPTLTGTIHNSMLPTKDFVIFVLPELLDLYLAHTYWNLYNIQPIGGSIWETKARSWFDYFNYSFSNKPSIDFDFTDPYINYILGKFDEYIPTEE